MGTPFPAFNVLGAIKKYTKSDSTAVDVISKLI